MADEILSIDTETLDGIANAIRSKGGLPQSNKLSFPDGMISALQAIETEATVTPKIAPQQVTLTPSNTSFPIEAGFHDGTGTVKIETETGSANPTSTEQTYYPSAGKFFSSFYVGGTGDKYTTASGSVTVGTTAFVTISGLSFTPYGAFLFMLGDGSASYQSLTALWINGYDTGRTVIQTHYSTPVAFPVTATASNGTIEIGYNKYNEKFKGTYHYFIWGR